MAEIRIATKLKRSSTVFFLQINVQENKLGLNAYYKKLFNTNKIYFKLFLIVVQIGLFTYQSRAQPSTIKEKWQADWITTANKDTAKNSWLCFRKTFELKKNPQGKVLACVAVDSKYWLYINNKLVVFEGELKRGPTPDDTYYDEVDIGPYMKVGTNTIAVLVWFWGRDGFSHKNSGKAGLLFEAKIGKTAMIKSDTSWKTNIHPAYGFTGLPVPNYRLPEYNIHFDARKDIPDWYTSGFNDVKWPLATFAGKANEKPWNKLWKRPIPQWYNSGLVSYSNTQTWAAISNGQIVTMHLPKNLSITPYLKIEAPAGLLIDIRTDNYKGGSEYNVRTEYITKAGIQEFETFGYMNGHEVLYNIPAGVKILALKYREIRYNANFNGFFNSSDTSLNKLWVKSLNTMILNMRDAIQDVDRERSQWWGDAVIILGQIFYSADDKGIAAIRKSMSNLVEWQKKDSVLFSPMPSGSWSKELPSQMLAAVGRYGFYKYFEYTNDTTFIKYVYPKVKRYMDLWQMDSDNLVIHRKGGWDWFDWGNKIDVPVLDNAWYYMALDGIVRMAKVSGHPNDTAIYQHKMSLLKQAFNNKFWTGSAYSSPDYKYDADDRGNGLAVVAGLVNADRWKKLKPMLDTTYHAGPYMEKYILESYFKMGESQAGMDRMKKRYKKMINSPVTTLWEGWEIGGKGYGGGSYNHGWSGGPLTLMSQYIAGLSPGKPGYKTINIFPQPGNIKWINMGCETAAGHVEVSFKNTQASFELNINAKKGRTITVGIPCLKNNYSLIKANDKVVFKDDKAVKNNSVNYKGKKDGYLIFDVSSAKWKFRGIYR